MTLNELLIAVRAIHFAATVLVAGVVFFRFFVAEPAIGVASSAALNRLRINWTRTIWIALIVAILSAAAWFVLLATQIYGESISKVGSQGGFWTVATDTRFGQVWCGRLAMAVLLGAIVLRAPSQSRAWSFAAVVLAAAFLASLAWVGHAGASPGIDGNIHLTSDVLHLLAAGAWVGGLLPLVMLLASALRESSIGDMIVPHAVNRFSWLGIVSAGTLLMTGIINTRYLVVTIANLFGTDYGRLVVVKICLFLAMIGVATVNKFYLTPRLASAARSLQRNSLIETLFGIGVLLVVAVLGIMEPGGHVHAHAEYAAVPADAAFVHIHSEEGMADVTIAPGRAGTSRATIRLWHEDLTELDARAVTLSLTAPAAGSRPVIRPARLLADGSWEVGGIQLSAPGNWNVVVQAQLGPGRRLALDSPIVIEP